MKFDTDFKKGLIEYELRDGTVETLVGTINLKAFYRDMHDMFIAEKFHDLIKDPDGGFLMNQNQQGEAIDNKKMLNRTGDIFEKKYTIINLGNNSFEFECNWGLYHSSGFTEHGWFEITLDFECRTMSEVETLVGNKKKKLQKGDWEFRNKIVYKNNIIEKYLKTIPFVKNSQKLQELYIENFYKNKILHDIEYGDQNIVNVIYNVMNKHFNTSIHRDLI